jgi:PA14 domain/LysM domain
MFKSVGRRVGLILMAIVVLSALAIPAASAGTLAGPSERASGSQLGADKAGGWGCSRYYVVRRGDNLTRIAYRYGTTVNALMRCNNIWNPDVIYVGQRLCICWGYRPPPPPPPPPPPCRPYPSCQPHPPPPPPPPPQPGCWWGQYYNNRDLSGPPVLTRSDPVLMFNWGYGSPAPYVQPDNFSAQWTRSFYMQGGTWRVTVTTDDGVKVFADGVPVIDEWKVQAATTYIRDVVLPTGNHTFTVQYFDAEAVAQIGITIIKL